MASPVMRSPLTTQSASSVVRESGRLSSLIASVTSARPLGRVRAGSTLSAVYNPTVVEFTGPPSTGTAAVHRLGRDRADSRLIAASTSARARRSHRAAVSSSRSSSTGGVNRKRATLTKLSPTWSSGATSRTASLTKPFSGCVLDQRRQHHHRHRPSRPRRRTSTVGRCRVDVLGSRTNHRCRSIGGSPSDRLRHPPTPDHRLTSDVPQSPHDTGPPFAARVNALSRLPRETPPAREHR